MEDRRQLVHEGDVEIALGVLDHLGGLRHLDRRRAMDAGGDHRAVDVGDDVERPGILARDDLGDGLEAMQLVAGIDALGRIADGEIAAGDEAGTRRQHRHAVFLDRAGIDRGFVDDDIALLQHATDGLRRRQHGAEIGPVRVVDRRRDGHDIEIRGGQEPPDRCHSAASGA